LAEGREGGCVEGWGWREEGGDKGGDGGGERKGVMRGMGMGINGGNMEGVGKKGG